MRATVFACWPVDTRTKPLNTLADDKPDDHDGYRGNGVIETKRVPVSIRSASPPTRAHATTCRTHDAANCAPTDNVRKLSLRGPASAGPDTQMTVWVSIRKPLCV